MAALTTWRQRMSMAVIGPMVGYLVKLACRAGIRRDVGVFLCAMLAI